MGRWEGQCAYRDVGGVSKHTGRWEGQVRIWGGGRDKCAYLEWEGQCAYRDVSGVSIQGGGRDKCAYGKVEGTSVHVGRWEVCIGEVGGASAHGEVERTQQGSALKGEQILGRGGVRCTYIGMGKECEWIYLGVVITGRGIQMKI